MDGLDIIVLAFLAAIVCCMILIMLVEVLEEHFEKFIFRVKRSYQRWKTTNYRIVEVETSPSSSYYIVQTREFKFFWWNFYDYSNLPRTLRKYETFEQAHKFLKTYREAIEDGIAHKEKLERDFKRKRVRHPIKRVIHTE